MVRAKMARTKSSERTRPTNRGFCLAGAYGGRKRKRLLPTRRLRSPFNSAVGSKMKTDVLIRKATSDDLEVIGRLWQEFMDFHRERDSHFARSADAHGRFKEFISGHINSDNSCVLVAEKEGSVVGYCLSTLAKYPPVFDKQDYGTIFDLAIAEPYHRMGIGERIYQTVQSWFSERGVRRIGLRVAVTNETSTAFWRKMGFKPYVETFFRSI